MTMVAPTRKQVQLRAHEALRQHLARNLLLEPLYHALSAVRVLDAARYTIGPIYHLFHHMDANILVQPAALSRSCRFAWTIRAVAAV
jgi:hypothetical protein